MIQDRTCTLISLNKRQHAVHCSSQTASRHRERSKCADKAESCRRHGSINTENKGFAPPILTQYAFCFSANLKLRWKTRVSNISCLQVSRFKNILRHYNLFIFFFCKSQSFRHCRILHYLTQIQFRSNWYWICDFLNV